MAEKITCYFLRSTLVPKLYRTLYCIAAASIDPSKTLLTLDPLARLIGTIGSSGATFPPGVEGVTIFRPIGTARRFVDEEALSQPDPQ